jgi:LPXTG-motif cell wall-anchored protein
MIHRSTKGSLMTRTFRFAAALAVACAAFLGMAGVASAQDSYTAATLTVDRTTVEPCGTINLVGENFLPDTSVSVVVGSTAAGPVLSDGTGRWTLAVTAPCEVGPFTVTASDGVNSITVAFEVLAAAAGGTPTGVTPSGALPYTGNDSSIPMAQIGAGLLAAGALIALTVRKRSQHVATVEVDA